MRQQRRRHQFDTDSAQRIRPANHASACSYTNADTGTRTRTRTDSDELRHKRISCDSGCGVDERAHSL